MRGKKRKCLCPLILGLAFLLFLSGCTEQIDIQNYLDTEVVRVNQSSLSMQDMMFYVMRGEEQLLSMAKAYDAEKTTRFFNTRVNGKYMRTWAKEQALEHAISDELYSQKARKLGLTLSKDRRVQVEETAQDLFFEMTEEQRETTHLTEKALSSLMEKMAYAEAYRSYMETIYGISLEEMEIDGDFYLDVKNTAEVEVNEEFWRAVRFGKITGTG